MTASARHCFITISGRLRGDTGVPLLEPATALFDDLLWAVCSTATYQGQFLLMSGCHPVLILFSRWWRNGVTLTLRVYTHRVEFGENVTGWDNGKKNLWSTTKVWNNDGSYLVHTGMSPKWRIICINLGCNGPLSVIVTPCPLCFLDPLVSPKAWCLSVIQIVLITHSCLVFAPLLTYIFNYSLVLCSLVHCCLFLPVFTYVPAIKIPCMGHDSLHLGHVSSN